MNRYRVVLHKNFYMQDLVCNLNNLRLIELTNNERKNLLISYYLFFIRIIL